MAGIPEKLEIAAGKLQNEFPGLAIDINASWNRHTTLGAGTASFFLVTPQNESEAENVIRLLTELEIGIFPLGAGSNLAGSDDYLPLAFLSTQKLTRFACTDTVVSAGAGLRLSDLARQAAELELGGLASLSGIPGTLGGAVVMNAGANGDEIGPRILSVRGFDCAERKMKTLELRTAKWAYRTSPVSKDFIILNVVLQLEKSSSELEMGKIRSELQRRAAVTPRGRSAGSIFRNPENKSAGRLLEEYGCKKLSAGAFQVAPEHANWIVSRNDSIPRREKDLRQLICAMRKAAASNNVTLQLELRFVRMEKLNILVLKGGTSSEREVSLISGKAVADALRTKGHHVEEYDITELKITDAMRKADVVYPVLHGGFGEDGRIQALLEQAGIKFVGCGSKACMDLMDKVSSKQIMEKAGVRTAAYEVVEKTDAPVIGKFGFPVIVKPPCEGSTFGLSLVESPDEWKAALELAFKHDKVALVEKYIKGVEATVGILDGKALPLVEIRYPGKLYDYDAKYTHAHGETKYICPPTGLSEKACRDAADQALRFYKASNARDMLRVDVIIDDKDQAWVLEGNTLPGCTPSSLLPKAAATAGIPFADMCDRLAHAAAER